MGTCRYCGVKLKGDWRDKVHRKICKNVSPEVRYIHSGLPQIGWPDAKREPCGMLIIGTKINEPEELG